MVSIVGADWKISCSSELFYNPPLFLYGYLIENYTGRAPLNLDPLPNRMARHSVTSRACRGRRDRISERAFPVPERVKIPALPKTMAVFPSLRFVSGVAIRGSLPALLPRDVATKRVIRHPKLATTHHF